MTPPPSPSVSIPATVVAEPLTAADRALREGHKVVVVMPAYNAVRTLQSSWQQIPQAWVDRVILVDDGSQDGTPDLAKTLPLDVIAHPHNVGYGGDQKKCHIEGPPPAAGGVGDTERTRPHLRPP